MPVLSATSATATKTGPTKRFEILDMVPTIRKYPGPYFRQVYSMVSAKESSERRPLKYVVNGARSAGDRLRRDRAIRVRWWGKTASFGAPRRLCCNAK